MTLFILFCLYVLPIIVTLYIIRYSNIKRIKNNKAPEDVDTETMIKVLFLLLIPILNIFILCSAIYFYFQDFPISGSHLNKFKNWLEGK